MESNGVVSRPSEHRAPNKSPNDEKTALPSTETLRISLIDIVRVIAVLIFAVGGLSYYISNGESLLFGKRPWFTRPDLVKQYFKGEILLTPTELSHYDGSNPDLPVYLALNGTIYDVSAGRHTYGPGGSYQYFAGRDSTRGFVTGCFAQDTTGDLRGAEEMFIPIDDPDDDTEKSMTNAEKKVRREKEKRDAKKKVKDAVEKWEKFYANSKKYFKVGKVVGQAADARDPPELCEQAKKSRPKRKKTIKEKVKEEL